MKVMVRLSAQPWSGRATEESNKKNLGQILPPQRGTRYRYGFSVGKLLSGEAVITYDRLFKLMLIDQRKFQEMEFTGLF